MCISGFLIILFLIHSVFYFNFLLRSLYEGLLCRSDKLPFLWSQTRSFIFLCRFCTSLGFAWVLSRVCWSAEFSLPHVHSILTWAHNTAVALVGALGHGRGEAPWTFTTVFSSLCLFFWTSVFRTDPATVENIDFLGLIPLGQNVFVNLGNATSLLEIKGGELSVEHKVTVKVLLVTAIE